MPTAAQHIERLERENRALIRDLKRDVRDLRIRVSVLERKLETALAKPALLVDFRMAFREMAKYARLAVEARYNANLPRGTTRLNAASFQRAPAGVDSLRLEAAFGDAAVPYELLRYIQAALDRGDRMAHKFNTQNMADLDELLSNLNRVPDTYADERKAFKQLAGVWKSTLSAMAVQRERR